MDVAKDAGVAATQTETVPPFRDRRPRHRTYRQLVKQLHDVW